MDIKLPDEQIRDIAGAAIAQLLTPEKRDEILKQAIVSLLKSGQTQYDRRSELEKVFDQVVREKVREIIDEYVNADSDAMKKIREVTIEAFEAAFSADKRKILVDKLTNVISENLWRDR